MDSQTSDAVAFEGLTLPPADFRQQPADFMDDGFFLATARREVDRLVERCGLKAWSSLLDVGCGAGRLAIALTERFGEEGGLKRYEGVDVDRRAIDWCSTHLAPGRPWMRFTRLDVRNERYNPDGAPASASERILPFDEQVFDVVNVSGVFTHMNARDVALYLYEVARVLSPRGVAFCTGYIEKDVDDYTENPRGYRGDNHGRLNRVRFSIDKFDRMVLDAGLRVVRFDHVQEADGQTGVYLAKDRPILPMPEGRKLEIGPGRERLDGFETLNIATAETPADHVVDAAAALPFDDDTFGLIYASHVLEHVPWYLTEQTLKEWVRVLRPGGLLEVWVPDGLKIARAFVEAEDALDGWGGADRTINDGWYRFNPRRDPCVWAAGRTFTYGDGPPGVNYASPNWHRALFSPRRLLQCMRDAGLVDVTRLDRSQVRGDDHGWINLGFRGVKPEAGKA